MRDDLVLAQALVRKMAVERTRVRSGGQSKGEGEGVNALSMLLVDKRYLNGYPHRHYSSKASVARGAGNQPISAYRIPASEIEPVVLREIIGFLRDANRLTDAIGLVQSTPDVIDRARSRGTDLAAAIVSALPGAQHDLIDQLVESVEITGDELRIKLKRGALLGASDDDAGTPVMIAVSGQLTRHGMANRLVVEGTRADGTSDEPLIRAIACERAWFEELASGRAASFREIAERVGVTDRYVGRIVDLAFLAPDVVEAMLNGEQAADVTVKSLAVDGSVPMLWDEQRRSLSIDARCCNWTSSQAFR